MSVDGDDGETIAYKNGEYGSWRLAVSSTPTLLEIAIERCGQRPPSAERLTLLLPAAEVRPVRLFGGALLDDRCDGNGRRLQVGWG